MKKQDAVNWAVSHLGDSIDKDKFAGAQCVDFIVAFADENFDIWPKGNAVDLFNYAWPKSWQRIKNTEDFVPQEGDIFIFDDGSYGHTGMIMQANAYLFDSIDQNWYNSSKNGSPASYIEDHVYDNFVGVIRPPYDDAEKGATTKSTKIETINKSINYNMNSRGSTPAGVVIHNTADSLSAKQSHNGLINASYSRYEAGVAHYYVDRNTVWRAINTTQIAWHLSDTYGNTNYLGFEVNESMSASNKEFLANEQATLRKAGLDLYYYGLPVNRTTVKVHHEFVATACPHRSLLLHTGWDAVSKGAPSQAITNKLKDYFIKEIKKYYNNPALQAGQPDTAPKNINKETRPTESHKNNLVKGKGKKVSSDGWRKNKNGIYWKSEKATFTCKALNSNGKHSYIITRFNGVWTGFPEAGKLYYGQSVNYDEVYDYDGYIWIAWSANGANGEVRVYMPIGYSDGHHNRQGKAFGEFS